jgi:hypothetical protein
MGRRPNEPRAREREGADRESVKLRVANDAPRVSRSDFGATMNQKPWVNP